MCPGREVSKYLRLASASLAPEEHACVVALETLVGNASDLIGAPEVVAELMVTLPSGIINDYKDLQVELIDISILRLEIM